MQARQTFTSAIGLLVLAGCGFLAGCSTGVETSPDPGILRVTLQADPADTTISITGQTIHVSPDDSFDVKISQGQVYVDSLFAALFTSTASYQYQDVVYNVLRQEGGSYKEYVIFESYVPPRMYDQLQFGVTASLLSIGSFQIPVTLPEGAAPLISLEGDFEVESGRITEVKIRIKPLSSVQRYRDTYLFDRQFEVVEVNQL